MRSPLVIPSSGKSTLPVLDRATVSRPTFSCSRVVVLAISCGTSRITSAGLLSRRSPWNLGWRSRPSVVHSLKPICATSRGLVQCTPRRGAGRPGRTGCGPAPARRARRAAGAGSAGRTRSPPCPRRPAARHCRSTPSSRAPRPVRLPCGSVYPPMTNSWLFSHLNFSQSLVRPLWYGASARLAMSPSQPWRHASA